MPTMRNDSTLTVSQAARELGVPVTTLRRWTNRNLVPFLRTPGGQRRFTNEQIRQIKKSILTTTEAAAELGVSAKTLRRWASADKVPHTLSENGHYQFSWDDIREIRDRMRHHPAPHASRAA